MPLPNFLIIGAAKAGTSSLYYYLNQHPDIFMSRIKGPAYFAYTEGARVRVNGPGDQAVFDRTLVTQFDSYQRLFAEANGETAIGEASVLYMYKPLAPDRIRACLPDVKLIACLRNPVDRAFSSYMHLRRDGRERLLDFEAALSAEPQRIKAGWQHLWHYSQLGLYHQQLQRYYARFPREQIGIFLYDDFVDNPTYFMRSLFDFLGVDCTFMPDMSVRRNVSGLPKSRRIHSFLTQPNWAADRLRRMLPPTLRQRAAARLVQWNLDTRRQTLTPALRARLTAHYRDEIMRLETLIERDLSTWLTPPRPQ